MAIIRQFSIFARQLEGNLKAARPAKTRPNGGFWRVLADGGSLDKTLSPEKTSPMPSHKKLDKILELLEDQGRRLNDVEQAQSQKRSRSRSRTL